MRISIKIMEAISQVFGLIKKGFCVSEEGIVAGEYCGSLREVGLDVEDDLNADELDELDDEYDPDDPEEPDDPDDPESPGPGGAGGGGKSRRGGSGGVGGSSEGGVGGSSGGGGKAKLNLANIKIIRNDINKTEHFFFCIIITLFEILKIYLIKSIN